MASEESVLSFPSLLKSVDFFSKFYQKNFIRFSGNTSGLNHLLDERDLRAVIQFLPEDSNSLKLVFNGIGLSLNNVRKEGIIDFNQLMRQHNGGATFILNMLNHHSNRLYHFNRYLESIFEGYVHTNFYGTPMNSRGFKPHSDSHDVFVIQFRGTKDWAFYEPKKKPNKFGIAYAIEDVEVTEETCMREGDVLYVPRGLIHAAKATDEVSWHLTIGITGFYWSDLLKEMIEQNAPSQKKLREVVAVKESKELIKEVLKRIITDLDIDLSVEDAREKFNKRFPSLGKHLDEIKLPNKEQLEALNRNTSFKVTEDKLSVSFELNCIKLNLPYREKPLKIHLRIKESIERITTGNPFKAKDLLRLQNEEEQVLLIYYLWNNGMIEPIVQ